ncbi:MAG: hypothetical protein VB104_00430 [Candidatus Limiplasma sp.]|nr:hypothetical protein [Candidatus Limiplasma sp.]
MEEMLQQIFDEAYDQAYAYFTLRKEEEESFTRQSLMGLLESLYVRQGNNWDGRGQAKDLAQSAMIAAAEAVLSEWPLEESNG